MENQIILKADKKIQNYNLRTANPQNVIFTVSALFLLMAFIVSNTCF
jgi:hypothetical protein